MNIPIQFEKGLLMILVTVLVIVLAGCAPNPDRVQPQDVIAVACQPSDAYLIERCAEAVGDVYETYQKRAYEIVSDPATPESVKAPIRRIDAELTPAVRTLVQTANAYVLARNASSTEAAQKRADLDIQLSHVKPRVQTLPKL